MPLQAMPALGGSALLNLTPSNFYIRKWHRFMLEYIFDKGIPKSENSNSTFELIFVFKVYNRERII